MTRIFISYRRSDSSTIAGRICDRLADKFGKDNVFKDSYGITPGEDFRGKIREQIALCDVLLVIIGPNWINITDENNPTLRRLDNPNDWVRLEVETGLQRRGALVIPVLVSSAAIPQESQLPFNLRELAFRNAISVRDDPDFRDDMRKLIEVIQKPRYRKIVEIVLFVLFTAILYLFVFRPGYRLGANIETNSQWSPTILNITPLKINGVDMVLVPKGCFQMGNDTDAHWFNSNADRYVKSVIDGGQQCFEQPFWIGHTEVTNKQFTDLGGRAANPPAFEGDNRPRGNVTWFEARDFCAKRGGRLPTEAEWEYAARMLGTIPGGIISTPITPCFMIRLLFGHRMWAANPVARPG